MATSQPIMSQTGGTNIPGYTGSEVADLIDILDGENYFAPTDKFARVRFRIPHLWANGNKVGSAGAEHDASGGGVPSFTTAKKGTIAIISVAGTVNGISVSRGDLIVALANNPSTAAYWGVLKDATAEIETLTESLQGETLRFRPNCTYFFSTQPDPDEMANWQVPDSTQILVGKDSSWLYQVSNATYAIANENLTTITAASLAANQSYADPASGDVTYGVTRMTCTTAAHASRFVVGELAAVHSSALTPNSAGTDNSFVSETFTVGYSDPATGYVYATEELKWFTELDGAASISAVTLNKDRAVTIVGGGSVTAAPAYEGNSLGWYKTGFGSEQSCTVTAGSGNTAGSTRTLTFATPHNLTDGHKLQVLSGTGVYTQSTSITCAISSVTSLTCVITMPATVSGVAKFDDATGTPTLPTSGTIYFRPAFDDYAINTGHGMAIICEHASGSKIQLNFNGLWGGGVMLRNSSYCNVDITVANGFSTLTSNYNCSGRLGYAAQPYALSKENVITVNGSGYRHILTDGAPYVTSSSFVAANWYKNSAGLVGNICANSNVKGGISPFDTHADSTGQTFTNCVSTNPFRGNTENSLEGMSGGVRGSNCTWNNCLFEGGHLGLYFRASDANQKAGSVHTLNNVTFKNIGDNNNNTSGIFTEDISGLANPYKIILNNVTVDNVYGYAIRCAKGNVMDGTSVNLIGISAAGIYADDTGIFRNQKLDINFQTNPRASTTRYCIRMEDTAVLDVAVMNVTLGASNNPTAIFSDTDNTSGKTVRVGVLNIIDPSLVGMPALFESVTAGTVGSGSETKVVQTTNFSTYSIGQIYYNGKALKTAGIGHIKLASGQWAIPEKSTTISTSAFASSNTIAKVIEFYVPETTTYEKIGTSITTIGTATEMHMGVYRANSQTSGTLITGSDVTSGSLVGIVAATEVSVAFSPPLTLSPGWHYLLGYPNGGVTTMIGINLTGVMGAQRGVTNLTDIDATGNRCYEVTGLTYGALPSSITLTKGTSSTVPLFGLKVL